MQTLNSTQTEKLINYKNQLINESNEAYQSASLLYPVGDEEALIKEQRYVTKSIVMSKIAKDLDSIIYNK